MNTIRICFLRTTGLMIGILIGWTFSGIAQDRPKLRVAITDFSTTSQNPPDTPIDESDDFWLGLSLYIGEAQHLLIEFDDISGW